MCEPRLKCRRIPLKGLHILTFHQIYEISNRGNYAHPGQLLNVGKQTYFSLNNNMQWQRLYFSGAVCLFWATVERNMVVQHGGLRGRRPVPHVDIDINGSF